jgi:hypothetical protein
MKMEIEIPEAVYRWVKTQWVVCTEINNIFNQVMNAVYNGKVIEESIKK